MNVENLYSMALYEVLGENTQKYTSTTVSGGGGVVAGTGHGVYGHSAPVTSTTHYHSDQSVWVRNLHTGNERKFEFNSYNVDVRPGHKLICAWNDKSEKLERIYNLDTHMIHAASGVYNDWTGIGKTLSQPKGSFWASLLRFSLWPSIPFLSVLHALVTMLSYISFGSGPYWGEKAPKIRKYGLLLLITDSVLFLWAFLLSQSYRPEFIEWLFYMMAAMVPFTILHKKIIDAEFAVVKAHSEALDQHLYAYARNNEKLWNANAVEQSE